jgi:hypothetical protein
VSQDQADMGGRRQEGSHEGAEVEVSSFASVMDVAAMRALLEYGVWMELSH